ncbi:MAG: hypothetical protein AAF074_01350 [Pseudomonadota bacterium]
MLALYLATPAEAIVFDFFWTGDPLADPTIVSSSDPTLRAVGTVEIDALPGASFSLGDILSTSIAVSGDSIIDFTFTEWTSAGGTIAADGMSASFNAAGNPFVFGADGSFGCSFFECGNGPGDFYYRSLQPWIGLHLSLLREH